MITFDELDLIFGNKPAPAYRMLDGGADRATIREKSGQVLAVANASFTVAPGELLVVMGLSGSGKSSLVRCINGLNGRGGDGGKARGQVRVGDVDVTRCGAKTLRQLRMHQVSMVFQQFGLMPWRTIAENVGFALELQGLGKAERARRVEERLALVGLAGWEDRLPHELSGGMQQRVGLARAFATDSPILLMDEPFSALDPLIRRQLQDELLALRDRLGKTIVFISHDIEEALRLGNRIAIMQEGRILQLGTPRQIVTEPSCDAVRRFVENANPLDALTGETMMRPLSAFDAGMRHELETAPRRCGATGRDRPLEAGEHFVAPASLPLRHAARLLHEGRRPLLLVDSSQMLVGVLTEREILGGIVGAERQPERV